MYELSVPGTRNFVYNTRYNLSTYTIYEQVIGRYPFQMRVVHVGTMHLLQASASGHELSAVYLPTHVYFMLPGVPKTQGVDETK